MATAPVPSTISSGPCRGPVIPGMFAATLGVDSSASVLPTVANVTLSVAYAYTWNYSPSHGPSTLSCVSTTSTNVTDGSGRATLHAPVPATSCGSGGCSYYAGPYGPVKFGDPVGDPPGYFLTSVRSGAEVTMAFVRALDQLLLSPYGRTVVSVLAPTTIEGLPEAGNGGPSPATLAYDWHLAGSGWSVVAGARTPNLTVVASDGAGPATVDLWTNGSYNGTAADAGPVVLDLSAAATAISGTSVGATSLDAGERTTLLVTGTGAGGYTYTAQFDPGLGAPSVNASCTTSVVAGGLVDLACSTGVAYARAGSAWPSVNLTNGYSTASHPLAPIQVAPLLGVSVDPPDLAAYVNATVRITVAATSGSGTPPYGPACLSTGDGRWLCSNASGPWPFDVAWGKPGALGGVASVVDSAGVNRSVGYSIDVVQRPMLGEIVPSSSDPTVGGNITLSSSVDGGAFPVQFWWNDSAPAGTLYAGAVDRSSPLVLRYDPTVGGRHNVTLTILDALGTRASQLVALYALPGNPVAVEPFGPLPAAYVPAGTAWPLALVAVNIAGERVAMAAGNESLRIDVVDGRSPGPFWVNDSAGSSVLDPAGNASEFTLPLPPSLWIDGLLELNLTPTSAGVVQVALLGPLACAAAAAGRLDFAVTADTAHLALSDPRVVDPGARTNATLWRIADRFGNGAPGTPLQIRAVFGSSVWVTYPVAEGNASASFVWINFSAPSDVGGTVFVLGPMGAELLPPIDVPATTPTPWLPWALAGLLGGGAVGAVGGYAYRRRSRGRDHPEPDEDDLRRLAEGRAHVLARARTDRPTPLAELGRGFPGPPPDGAELADWVGALVSEGVLRALVGPDGRPGFVRVPERPLPPTLRVDVDPAALDQALAARDDPEAPEAGRGGRS